MKINLGDKLEYDFKSTKYTGFLVSVGYEEYKLITTPEYNRFSDKILKTCPIEVAEFENFFNCSVKVINGNMVEKVVLGVTRIS